MKAVPACRGLTDLMYSTLPEDVTQAKALCARCPVIIRCAVDAVRRHERYGVWGGWSPTEREALIKAVRRRAG